MSLDERGRRAAESLRERVQDDLVAGPMLASLPRTRTRRRMALVAPVAAAAVAVAAVLTASPGHVSTTPTGPSVPTTTPSTAKHENGPLFGAGDQYLRFPRGVYAPSLDDGSSPTWSPDGSEVAVLADGGILVTNVQTAATHTVSCDSCAEIAWSPDGRLFAAVGQGPGVPALRLVDATTGDAKPVPLRDVQTIRSITWAPDSQSLAFLAVSPRSEQGGWTVRADGSQQTQFMGMLTSFPMDQSGYSGALQLRWSPTTASIAVLFATADDRGQHAPGGPFRLDVQTMHSDGATPNHLISAGRCTCAAFTPNLVWSPDGTTVAVFALHDRPTVSRIDGDGRTVLVRFVRGSGPLSWQPLPGGH
jgi:Tol biopolymer transport system component